MPERGRQMQAYNFWVFVHVKKALRLLSHIIESSNKDRSVHASHHLKEKLTGSEYDPIGVQSIQESKKMEKS